MDDQEASFHVRSLRPRQLAPPESGSKRQPTCEPIGFGKASQPFGLFVGQPIWRTFLELRHYPTRERTLVHEPRIRAPVKQTPRVRQHMTDRCWTQLARAFQPEPKRPYILPAQTL